jgi:hypothetical protein
MVKMNSVKKIKFQFIKEKRSSFYICAAGFEDRVLAIVENLKDKDQIFFKYSLILEYSVHKADNKFNLKKLQDNLPKISDYLLENAIVDIDKTYHTENNIVKSFKKIPLNKVETVFIDISGMANFLILLIIHYVKKIFFDREIIILYTEAKTYYPTKEKRDEILKLIKSYDEDDILKLGEELGASGTREVIIIPNYKGNFDETKPICLIFFVGYEPSRASGLLDTYRPNMIVACYGVSTYDKFKWRTELSKKLHTQILQEFEHVDKYISIFNISEIVNDLDKIYKSVDNKERLLYEYYNIAITPQCSKLQTVAIYLFSQRHPDVQIVFCFPGKFNPERYSNGIGETWFYKLQNI